MRRKITKINHHGFFITTLKAFLRVFKKKPVIHQMVTPLPNVGIYIANHSGASGPFNLSLHFPILLVPWGAYPMTEGYSKRWKYLYHVFYQQKLGYTKFKSFLISTPFALISKLLYNGISVIPTYQDIRLRQTIKASIEHLQVGNSLLIFPEDSKEGYHDVMTHFNGGFVYLAIQYYEQCGIDLPIIPIYYDSFRKKMVIDNIEYIQPLIQKGMSREDIAEYFRKHLNQIGIQIKNASF